MRIDQKKAHPKRAQAVAKARQTAKTTQKILFQGKVASNQKTTPQGISTALRTYKQKSKKTWQYILTRKLGGAIMRMRQENLAV